MQRNPQGSDHIDLLPFIAILMCMLGCLLLVTMSVAALNMGPGAGEGWTPSEAPPTPHAKNPEPSDPASLLATSDEGTNSTSPILVEWDGVTACIHRDEARQHLVLSEPVVLTDKNSFFNRPGGKIRRPGTAEWNGFLEEMAGLRATHYALFAVRPSGFDGFWMLRSEFESRGLSLGYEPINQDKPVRLVLNRNAYATPPTP